MSDKRTQASVCAFVWVWDGPMPMQERTQEVSSMVDAVTTQHRKQMQKKRIELRFDPSCMPHPWRRFLVAGITVCESLRILAERLETTDKGEDEHDSS